MRPMTDKISNRKTAKRRNVVGDADRNWRLPNQMPSPRNGNAQAAAIAVSHVTSPPCHKNGIVIRSSPVRYTIIVARNAAAAMGCAVMNAATGKPPMPAALHRPDTAPTPIWPGDPITRVSVQPDNRISDITSTIVDTASRAVSAPKASIADTENGRTMAAPAKSAMTRRQSTWARMPRA